MGVSHIQNKETWYEVRDRVEGGLITAIIIVVSCCISLYLLVRIDYFDPAESLQSYKIPCNLFSRCIILCHRPSVFNHEQRMDMQRHPHADGSRSSIIRRIPINIQSLLNLVTPPCPPLTIKLTCSGASSRGTLKLVLTPFRCV